MTIAKKIDLKRWGNDQIANRFEYWTINDFVAASATRPLGARIWRYFHKDKRAA